MNLVRSYEDHGWLSPTQRAELVALVADGMEEVALRLLVAIPDERE